MSSEPINCCCVIGPVKSGTTLMISLLDGHPELMVIPLEVKFFTHWFERLSKGDIEYKKLNEFFLHRSKIRLLNSDNKNMADIMNSGRVNFGDFNFKNFEATMSRDPRLEKYEDIEPQDLFKKYFLDLHMQLYKTFDGSGLKKTIVTKEGNHGAKHIEAIASLFPKTKFIVVVRDARDIYASLKAIAQKKTVGLVSPSFKSRITPCQYIHGNKGKNISTFFDVEAKSDSQEMIFVRYEDLVGDPESEMARVAEFLEIDFFETLVSPTNFGKPWGGNASSLARLDGVEKGRALKWKQELDQSELCILEYFLKEYLQHHNYELGSPTISRWRAIYSILISQLQAMQFNWRKPLKSSWRIYQNLSLTLIAITSIVINKEGLGRW